MGVLDMGQQIGATSNQERTSLRSQLRVRVELHMRSPVCGRGWCRNPISTDGISAVNKLCRPPA